MRLLTRQWDDDAGKRYWEAESSVDSYPITRTSHQPTRRRTPPADPRPAASPGPATIRA